jgi:hypothetical protein
LASKVALLARNRVMGGVGLFHRKAGQKKAKASGRFYGLGCAASVRGAHTAPGGGVLIEPKNNPGVALFWATGF